MNNLKIFPDFCKYADISPENHHLCMFKCKVATGCMVKCCNPNGNCPNIAHAACSNLNPEVIKFLSFWYCTTCIEHEPELFNAYGEELTGAISLSTLHQLVTTRQIKPSELPGIMKENTTYVESHELPRLAYVSNKKNTKVLVS